MILSTTFVISISIVVGMFILLIFSSRNKPPRPIIPTEPSLEEINLLTQCKRKEQLLFDDVLILLSKLQLFNSEYTLNSRNQHAIDFSSCNSNLEKLAVEQNRLGTEYRRLLKHSTIKLFQNNRRALFGIVDYQFLISKFDGTVVHDSKLNHARNSNPNYTVVIFETLTLRLVKTASRSVEQDQKIKFQFILYYLLHRPNNNQIQDPKNNYTQHEMSVEASSNDRVGLEITHRNLKLYSVNLETKIPDENIIELVPFQTLLMPRDSLALGVRLDGSLENSTEIFHDFEFKS